MKISQFIVGLAITLSVNIAIAGGSTWAKASSEYTKCTDSYSCRGKGGYAVEISQNNGTYLQLFYNGTQIHDKSWDSYHLPPAFEWRFHYEKGKKVYHALIYRSKTQKRNDLNVIRLGREQSCYIGKIARSNNMNVKARQLADDRSKQCSSQYADNNVKHKPSKSNGYTWKKSSSQYTKCTDASSCRGKGGYAVDISQNNGTYLQLFYNGTQIHDKSWNSYNLPPAFEWRFHYEKGKKVYHALIYRSKTKKRNDLNIIRLGREQSCYIGKIARSNNMNVKARQLADNKNAPCADNGTTNIIQKSRVTSPQAMSKNTTDKPARDYSTTSWGKTGSEYIKDAGIFGDGCIEISSKSDEAEDYSKVCKGKGNYTYEMYLHASVWQYIRLFYNNKMVAVATPVDDREWEKAVLGDILEWRFHYKNGKKVYHALISSKILSDYKKETKYLIVFRLDKENSCYIGKIPQSKNMNIKARQLADDKNAKCISYTENNTEVTTDDSTDTDAGNTDSNLKFLQKSNKKYPYEIDLLSNHKFTQRIKNLIGTNKYNFLVKTWAVETPIEATNSVFVANGCEQHNCGATNFLIVVDFTKNIMQVGFRKQNKITIFSEDGSKSKEIIQWSKRY